MPTVLSSPPPPPPICAGHQRLVYAAWVSVEKGLKGEGEGCGFIIEGVNVALHQSSKDPPMAALIWLPLYFSFLATIVVAMEFTPLWLLFRFLSTENIVTTPPIRLVGGNSSWEGRVEVFIQGQWGTVCDDLWSSMDARVVCRQLGFGANGAIARTNAYFGQGTGPIVLDNVMCNGTEMYLTDCPSNGFFVHNCFHNEDAGVTCIGE